jgi:hypothetical protein
MAKITPPQKLVPVFDFKSIFFISVLFTQNESLFFGIWMNNLPKTSSRKNQLHSNIAIKIEQTLFENPLRAEMGSPHKPMRFLKINELH